MRYVVGVAGKMCAGKDQVVAILRDEGFVEINVDRVGHEALTHCKERIIAAFGASVTTGTGEIDRRALGSLVFSDRNALAELERIVHPDMVRIVEERIERAGTNARIAVNAALLFHMGLQRACHHVIVVRALLPVRIWRAIRRDGSSLRAVFDRIARQRGLSFSDKSVDITTVGNSGSMKGLRRRVRRVLADLDRDQQRAEQ